MKNEAILTALEDVATSVETLKKLVKERKNEASTHELELVWEVASTAIDRLATTRVEAKVEAMYREKRRPA